MGHRGPRSAGSQLSRALNASSEGGRPGNIWGIVACGASHTIALRSGRVWTWGDRTKFQLGHGDRDDRFTPAMVNPEFLGTEIGMIAACADYSVAVSSACPSKHGLVWTWGDGGAGCLGTGDRHDREFPARIDTEAFGGSPVSVVAAGDLHCVAVTTEGTLYAWGNEGLLGLGGLCDGDRLRPTCVGGHETFGGAQVVLAAAGGRHTLCITQVFFLCVCVQCRAPVPFLRGAKLAERQGWRGREGVAKRACASASEHRRFGAFGRGGKTFCSAPTRFQ